MMSVLTPHMESVLQSTVIAREKPWMHFETAYDQDGIQLEHVEMQAPPPVRGNFISIRLLTVKRFIS